MEPDFKMSLSLMAKLKVLLYRLAAIGVIVFSIYMYEVNTVFFPLLIVFALSILLFAALKEVEVYTDFIIIRHKSLIPVPFLNKKYYLSEIKEFDLDMPDRVAEMIITKQDPLTVNYKLIILFKERNAVKISLESPREELVEKVQKLNSRLNK